MAESSKPVEDTPAAAETTATSAEASANPKTANEPAVVSNKTETAPAVKTSTGAVVAATADASPAQTVPMVDEATEGPKKSVDKIEPISDGVLGYKDPSTMMSKFKFSKRHVWLGEEPITTQNMSHYLRAEKPEVAHPVTAWASQTGKGLLFLTKQADQKAQPHGALNLSDASNLMKDGVADFSFKLYGHKHTFQATTMRERDGWFLAIEKTIEDAKATREEVLGSFGYKESMGKLDKPAVMANASAEHPTPKKSTDLKSSDEARVGGRSEETISDEEKRKKKSRSASRGKRNSIFGAILGNKEGYEKHHDDIKAVGRKSEDAKGKEKAIEPAEEAQEVPVTTSPEVTASAPTGNEQTTESTKPIEAKAEDTPMVSAEKTEETSKTTTTGAAAMPAKPTKRTSIFGQFFDKVRTPGHEKKEHEVVPAVSSKDEEVTASPVHEPVANTDNASADATVKPTVGSSTSKPGITGSEAKEEKDSKEVEKENFLGKLLNRDRSKSPAADARAEKKDDTVLAATPTEPSAQSTDAAIVAAPAAEGTTATSAATPEVSKDKRRTSFFGNLGGSAKKEKKPTEISTEGEKPAGESKPISPIPRLSSIFRKPSQGVKTSKDTKAEKPAGEPGAKNGGNPKVVEEQATTMETSSVLAQSQGSAGVAGTDGTSDTKPKDKDSAAISGSTVEKKDDTAPAVTSTA